MRLARSLTDEVTFLGAHVVPDGIDGRRLRRPRVRRDARCGGPARPLDRRVLRASARSTPTSAGPSCSPGATPGSGCACTPTSSGHGPGVQLAVELGCASADHCTYLSDDDVAALAGSDTVATFLPATDFSTRQPYPDARRVIDAGATVALATNCNPGSSYTTSMSFVIALAVRDLHMTATEALTAATLGGALALAPRRRRLARVRVTRRPRHPRRPALRPPRLPTRSPPDSRDDHGAGSEEANPTNG